MWKKAQRSLLLCLSWKLYLFIFFPKKTSWLLCYLCKANWNSHPEVKGGCCCWHWVQVSHWRTGCGWGRSSSCYCSGDGRVVTVSDKSSAFKWSLLQTDVCWNRVCSCWNVHPQLDAQLFSCSSKMKWWGGMGTDWRTSVRYQKKRSSRQKNMSG